MKIISPTGEGIRIRDDWGSGLFGAPRGSGFHYGLDFRCLPGTPAIAPITPISFGPSRPYANNPEYGGISLETDLFIIELWYVELYKWLSDPRAVIKQGWEIGTCQDIREKKSTSTGQPFGNKMTPHLHMQIRIKPELLLPRVDRLFINPEILL